MILAIALFLMLFFFCYRTGKTSVVIETILKVFRESPTKRILACAPSDAAADVICERLAKHLNPAQMLRLNWWQRISASVPVKLRPYCLDVNDIFEFPSVQQVGGFNVIVCNCGTAGALKTLPASVGFDLVIVDEASQAIESEVSLITTNHCFTCYLSVRCV